MPSSLRQQQSAMLPADEDWLSVGQAAAVTGDSLRSWERRAAWECRLAQRQGRQSLARKAPPASGKGKPIWYVRPSLDRRLTRCPSSGTREDGTHESLIAKFPEHAVALAYRKARWLREWLAACDRRRHPSVSERELAEEIVNRARQVEGDDFSISFRSLQAWSRAYNTRNTDGRLRGVEALIDGRAAARRHDDTTETAPTGRSPEAIAYFQRLFHTESKNSVKVCHELTAREASKHGWSWSPSYSATRKWVAIQGDRSLSFLLREGKDAWCRRFMPYIEIDPQLVEVSALYQTDHHACDFWIELEGKQIRPWLTVVIDRRSRVVVGHNLGPRPHQDAILASYLMAFRQWAIPERIHQDNGADFCSELITGLTKATRDSLRRVHGPDWRNVVQRDANLVDCVDPRFAGIVEELGIGIVYAKKLSPWSKGICERFFGTFEGRCGKTFATYCGRSAMAKPECLEHIRRGYTNVEKRRLRKRYGRDWKKVAVLKIVDQSAVPTLDEARVAVGEYVEEYHHTPHSADDMAGRTPLEVWHTARRLRRADDDALLFLMHARGIYRVGANGVSVKVGGARVKYGAGNPCLYKHTGRDVFIAMDPNALSCCFAFTPDRDQRRFIGKLDANKRISPMATVDELRDANAAVGRRRKIMFKAQRESAARTRTAVEEMAAKRKERARQLRATGTDNVTGHANIVPVQTGFEGSSNTVRRASPRRDRKSADLAAASAALSYGHETLAPEPTRPRATLDLIAPIDTRHGEPVRDDGTETVGMDAEPPKADLLGLIVGDRYERTERSE